MKPDDQLLREFAGSRDEAAFRELSRRYLGLIFHTALRRTGNPEIAREVSQNILCALARKASSLAGRPGQIGAWLHRATVYESSKAMRSERSFQRKKTAIPEIASEHGAPADPWQDAVTHLDGALDQLGEIERRVVLLHYFENKTFHQIAEAVGKSPGAVQRQAHRALEKLSRLLRGKGISIAVPAIAIGLLGEFSKAAPPSLLAPAAAHALSAGNLHSTAQLTILMATKSKLFIPLVILSCVAPLAVATAVGQRQSLADTRTRIDLLQQRIDSVSIARAAPDRTRGQQGESQEKIDWLKIAAVMENRGTARGPDEWRQMLLLEKSLMKMSPEAIEAALNEISGLAISDRIRTDLKIGLLVHTPIRKDSPEKAVRWFFELTGGPNGMVYELMNSWRQWASTDSGAAAAWLDSQIAAGKFPNQSLTGQSRERGLFEGVLLGELASRDPAAAMRRLATFPADSRSEVLLNPGFRIGDERLPDLAEIVRRMVPVEDQQRLITSFASRLVFTAGFEGVDDYLRKVQVSPAERQSIAVETVGKWIRLNSISAQISREKIDQARDWARGVAPGRVPEATGMALIVACDPEPGVQVDEESNRPVERARMGFEEAETLLLDYVAVDGSDDAIISFLSNPIARKLGVQAGDLAMKIKDPESRNSVFLFLGLPKR